MPRQASRELKRPGPSHEPGVYRFKITEVIDKPDYDSWQIKMDTWTESGEDGPKIVKLIRHSNYEKESYEDEPNRIFQVLCGKLDIDLGDMMGKTGYVVVSWDKNGYLSPIGRMAFFDNDRKDAFGEESISESLEYALSLERNRGDAKEDVKAHEGSSL